MVNSKGLIAGNDKIGQPNLEEEKKKLSLHLQMQIEFHRNTVNTVSLIQMVNIILSTASCLSLYPVLVPKHVIS